VLSNLLFAVFLGQSNAKWIQDGFVKTVDGVRLYYEKAGNGPVLIALGRLSSSMRNP
jgi:hypothetical protein